MLERCTWTYGHMTYMYHITKHKRFLGFDVVESTKRKSDEDGCQTM